MSRPISCDICVERDLGPCCLSATAALWNVPYPSVERGFPRGSLGKEPAFNVLDAGDAGLIRGSGRSPGGGQGNPLQYSCLENPMDGGAWWATVREVSESDATEATEHTHTLLRTYHPVNKQFLNDGTYHPQKHKEATLMQN